jgi:hypothetical protein
LFYSPRDPFRNRLPASRPRLTLAPQLIRQIEEMVKPCIAQSANPEWPTKWARMFDRDGDAWPAIKLLYVGSTKRELIDAVSTPWQSRSSLIQANSWALPLTPFPIRRKAITASSRVIVVVGGVGFLIHSESTFRP